MSVRIKKKATPKITGKKISGNNTTKKSHSWLLAIGIVIFLVLIIRLFAFQSFAVQNSYMAENLISGDWVFINKLVYGPRFPMTLLSVPFSPARTNPGSEKLFLPWPQLPYYRLPGLSHLKNNDLIAFNYPP